VKRRAKIIATIGPASEGEARLRQLIEAGMDVVRLNFSHGTADDHEAVIARVRKISAELGKAVAIMQDLQGPKLRTGAVENDRPVRLEDGERVQLTPEPVPVTGQRISIAYPALCQDIQPGDRILIDDGNLELRAESADAGCVQALVVVGGELGSHKGVNFPGSHLSVPTLTPKDQNDLAIGVRYGVEAVAMSFVRRPDDIQQLRHAIRDLQGGPGIQIVAKLERPEAIENLEAIIQQTDGVLVARGDLGVELPPEQVPSIQKEILLQANRAGKLTITATQMLESMITNPRPTRAEASDVANAVFDGSDALMLSGETAIGHYPVETVRTMARIIHDAEEHANQWGKAFADNIDLTGDDAVATTHAAAALAHDRNVQAIAVFTRSGRTASLIAKARPLVQILAFTPEQGTYARMAMLWGVTPYLVPMAHSVEEMISHVENEMMGAHVIDIDQQVVLVASLPVGAMGPANFSLLHTVGRHPSAKTLLTE
jgi:pyruvate kinase